MVMSPKEVRARISTASSPDPGRSAASRSLLHVAEARVEVQPGGDPVADPDLDLAEGGLGEDGAMRDLAEADVAVGGLRGNRLARPIDRDPAVGRVHPQVSGDLADPGVAVGVLDHRRAVDVVDPHGAGARGELGIAVGLLHGEVADAGPELHRARLVELDVADAGLVAALAEAALAAQCRHPGLTSQVGARRQLDLHVDRLAAPAPGELPPALGGLDQQPAAGVLDAGLLGGGHVGLLGGVARAHLDHGVGAVAGHDPEVTDAQLDGDGDRFGSIEGRHLQFLLLVGWLARPARVALRALRGASFGSTGRAGSFQGGGGRSHEPGVDRQPLARGCLLDPGLEVVGHAEVDPRHRALVALWDGWRPVVGSSARSSADGSAGGGVTTNSGSRPRRRSSTDPGASSVVISSAAAASASCRVSRIAASSGATSRSASARASSPPASAATASWRWRFSMYSSRFMAPLWHHDGAMSRHCLCHRGARRSRPAGYGSVRCHQRRHRWTSHQTARPSHRSALG